MKGTKNWQCPSSVNTYTIQPTNKAKETLRREGRRTVDVTELGSILEHSVFCISREIQT